MPIEIFRRYINFPIVPDRNAIIEIYAMKNIRVFERRIARCFQDRFAVEDSAFLIAESDPELKIFQRPNTRHFQHRPWIPRISDSVFFEHGFN